MAKTSAVGRPRIRSDEEILHAALEAFAASGYEGMSVRTLSADLGLSHETVNRRFGSKKDLYFAALDYGFTSLFDAIASEAKTAPLVSLTVLPAPAEGTFRLDGRPVQLVGGHVGVSSGDHYLQVGDSPATTYSLRVDGTTPPTLVLPSLVHSEVLEWAGDGEKRAALSAVLVSALGSEGVVYVVNAQVVWRVRLGGSAWDLVAMGAGPGKPATIKPATAKPTPAKPDAPLPTEPVATSPAARKKSPVGPVLMGIGGAAGVGGGVVFLLGELGARQVVNTAIANKQDHGSYDLTDADREAYVKGGKMVVSGGVVGGIGAALLATGLVVTVAF